MTKGQANRAMISKMSKNPLENLVLLHRLKNETNLSEAPKLKENPFFLDTCLRELWITTRENLVSWNPQIEKYEGTEAYCFLLRVACGLESEIKGETDIFGQLKTGWAKFSQNREDDLFRLLQRWMLFVFEDTKEIRTHYIEGLGGNSYGTLVRKLLKETPFESLLIVGAGQMAESMIPIFKDKKIFVWNRTNANAQKLKERFSNIQIEVDLDSLIHKTQVSLLCIPGESKDPFASRWLKQNHQTVIHLGITQRDRSNWQMVPSFFDLQNLFHLESKQQNIREMKFHRARTICKEKAILRSLDRSSTLHHGWEDLALFA